MKGFDPPPLGTQSHFLGRGCNTFPAALLGREGAESRTFGTNGKVLGFPCFPVPAGAGASVLRELLLNERLTGRTEDAGGFSWLFAN